MVTRALFFLLMSSAPLLLSFGEGDKKDTLYGGDGADRLLGLN
jgi:hypothetical protein